MFESCGGHLTLAGVGPAIHEQTLEVQAHYTLPTIKHPSHGDTWVPRGLERRIARFSAVSTNQLSYETTELAASLLYHCAAMRTEFVFARCRGARAFQFLAKLNPC